MTAIRRSRQRDAIMTYLRGRKDHPTAEMIYEALHKNDPSLSLGTVYRNLTLLTRMGEVREIGTDDGPDHFDADTSIHGHFICRKCLQVSDLFIKGLNNLMEEAEKESDCQVLDLSANFYGICAKCLADEKTSGNIT